MSLNFCTSQTTTQAVLPMTTITYFYKMTISFCLLLHSEDKALTIQILSKNHLRAQHLCILWGAKAARKALQNMYLSVGTPRRGILKIQILKVMH